MKSTYILNLTAAVALLAGSLAHAAEGPIDPQIVGIVLAADQIDIDYGKLALAKSKNKGVREFAQRMVTDHSAVQTSVIGLAAKLGVTGADSPTSTGLKAGDVDITKKLESLHGKELDRFYLDNEVSYHQTVTGAVDAVLIPSAQNAELKAALQGARPLFLKHLEHARMLQSGSRMMDHKKYPPMSRRLLLFLALALNPMRSAPTGKTHTVQIKGIHFLPERLEVEAGDTVIWTNNDIVPHTATARKFFDSKNLDKGQSWRFVANQKGDCRYICSDHPTMRGESVVK